MPGARHAAASEAWRRLAAVMTGRGRGWCLLGPALAACSPSAPAAVSVARPAASGSLAGGCEAERELLSRVRDALAAGRTGRALRLLDEPAPRCEPDVPRQALRAQTLAELAPGSGPGASGPQLLAEAHSAQLAGDPVAARRLRHRAARAFEELTGQPPRLEPRSVNGWTPVAWSPDGSQLARPEGNKIAVISTASWTEQMVLRGEEPILSAFLLPHGVLAGDEGGHLRLWDTRTGRTLAALEVSPEATVRGPTRDGSLLLRSVAETRPPNPDEERVELQALQLWDVAARAPRALVLPSVINEHERPMRAVESDDGQLLAVEWENNEITVVRLATGAVVARVQGKGDTVATLAFSPDSRLLAFRGARGYVLRDVATGHERTLRATRCDSPERLLFSPSGRLAVTGTSEYTVCVWDVARGQLRLRLPEVSKHPPAFEDQGMRTPHQFFADERALVVSGGFHDEVWDLRRRALVPTGQDVLSLLQMTRDHLWLGGRSSDLVEMDRELHTRTTQLEDSTWMQGGAKSVGDGLLLDTNTGMRHDLRAATTQRLLEGYTPEMGQLSVDPARRVAFAPVLQAAWELPSGRVLARPQVVEVPAARLVAGAARATLHLEFPGWLVSWTPLGTEPPVVRPLPAGTLVVWAGEGQLGAVREGQDGPLWQPLHPERPATRVCEGAPGGKGVAAISDDGRTVAWAAERGPLWVCRTDGSTARQVEGIERADNVRALPGDEGFLVGRVDGSIWRVSPAGAPQKPDEPEKRGLIELASAHASRQDVRPPEALAPGPRDAGSLASFVPVGRAEIVQQAVVVSTGDGRELARLALGSDGVGVVWRGESVVPFGKGEPGFVRCLVGPWVLPTEVCLDRLPGP